MATSHFRPFISRSHRAASASSASTRCIISAFSSACLSVRLSRYADSRVYFSCCSRSASRSCSVVAFWSPSTSSTGSSRTGVRMDGASRSVSTSLVVRDGDGGMLMLASESGDFAPCARDGAVSALESTRGGSVRRGLTGEGDRAVRKESEVVGVCAERAPLAGGDGSGSFGGPVAGGACHVRLSGGGMRLGCCCGVGARELCGECDERELDAATVLLRDSAGAS